MTELASQPAGPATAVTPGTGASIPTGLLPAARLVSTTVGRLAVRDTGPVPCAGEVIVLWSSILTDAGIAAGLQDTAAAATEAATWFAAYTMTAVISEPTRAAEIIADLTQQVGAFTWWDAAAHRAGHATWSRRGGWW